MSEENINIATKEYADAHFGNTSEINDNLVIATKEYVDSIPSGMVADDTALTLKGQLCNTRNVAIVGDGADGSTLWDGSYMFYECSALMSWTVDLPNLTWAWHMFQNCNMLTSWTVDLPKLTNASYMFYRCSGLTSWTADLPNLTNGTYMFYYCSKLSSWTVDLPNLTIGAYMFYECPKLSSWTVDLPNLTDGSYMFYYCTGLTSWTVDLPNLTNGDSMFYNCPNLGSWTVDLPNLTTGNSMFYNCILDEASVLHILNSIPSYTSGTHKLHLGKYTNYKTSDKVAAKLRTSTGGTVLTPISAGTNYRCVDDNGNDKGWTIHVQA